MGKKDLSITLYLTGQQIFIEEYNKIYERLVAVAKTSKIVSYTRFPSVLILVYASFLGQVTFLISGIVITFLWLAFWRLILTQRHLAKALAAKDGEMREYHDNFLWQISRNIIMASSRAKLNVSTTFRNAIQEQVELKTFEYFVKTNADGKRELRIESNLHQIRFKDILCSFSDQTGVWHVERLLFSSSKLFPNQAKSELWVVRNEINRGSTLRLIDIKM